MQSEGYRSIAKQMLRKLGWRVRQLRGKPMTGHGSKFGRKKDEAIVAILTQRSVDDAARSVGISTPTLLRWMKIPEFQDAYRAAKREAFAQSVGRLQQASAAAVSTLLKIMIDPMAPTSSRVRAAVSVIEKTQKALELEDIEARVTRLEQDEST